LYFVFDPSADKVLTSDELIVVRCSLGVIYGIAVSAGTSPALGSAPLSGEASVWRVHADNLRGGVQIGSFRLPGPAEVTRAVRIDIRADAGGAVEAGVSPLSDEDRFALTGRTDG
jgi:hypothetical protein